MMVPVRSACERIDVLRVAGRATLSRSNVGAGQGHGKRRHRTHEDCTRGPRQRTNHAAN